MQSAYIIASYANRMSTFVSGGISSSNYSRSWPGILRQGWRLLIVEEVNWQMADGGLHRGETDRQPQPWRSACAGHRNELATGCVSGMMVRTPFSTKKAGKLVTGTLLSGSTFFPTVKGPLSLRHWGPRLISSSEGTGARWYIPSMHPFMQPSVCWTPTHTCHCVRRWIQNGNRFSLHS